MFSSSYIKSTDKRLISCIIYGKDLETKDIMSQHLSLFGAYGGGATEVVKLQTVIDYLLQILN